MHGATGVVPADYNGLSDPFSVLQFGDSQPFKSRKIAKTLEPRWRDEYRFPVAFGATLDKYRLHIQVSF